MNLLLWVLQVLLALAFLAHATIFHIVRAEVSSAVITALLLVMATFVAYMRWRAVRF
jgi:hypothetical protein